MPCDLRANISLNRTRQFGCVVAAHTQRAIQSLPLVWSIHTHIQIHTFTVFTAITRVHFACAGVVNSAAYNLLTRCVHWDREKAYLKNTHTESITSPHDKYYVFFVCCCSSSWIVVFTFCHAYPAFLYTYIHIIAVRVLCLMCANARKVKSHRHTHSRKVRLTLP